MTDLVLQGPVLERTAGALARVRDSLEACAHAVPGGTAGLGAPELDAAAGETADRVAAGVRALAAAADDLREQARAASTCFAELDAALVPRR